jgi:hypothetical protein
MKKPINIKCSDDLYEFHGQMVVHEEISMEELLP